MALLWHSEITPHFLPFASLIVTPPLAWADVNATVWFIFLQFSSFPGSIDLRIDEDGARLESVFVEVYRYIEFKGSTFFGQVHYTCGDAHIHGNTCRSVCLLLSV